MDTPHDATDAADAAGPAHDRAGLGDGWSEVLPLTTVETFVAAMIEAGPEVAEHMVRAANELLLAAQALMGAAERRLAEQRRLRETEAAEATGPADRDAATSGATADAPATTTRLRSVDEVA